MLACILDCVIAYTLYWLLSATAVERRKLHKLIDSNLVQLRWITAGITSIVISYKRNC